MNNKENKPLLAKHKARKFKPKQKFDLLGAPLEIRELIIENVLQENFDSKTIIGLNYLLHIKDFLTASTRTKIRDKIALYHALYIINKVSSATTQEQIKQLRLKASTANGGITFWNDIPEYSLWSRGIGLKLNTKKEFHSYVKNSKNFALDLEHQLQESPYILSDHEVYFDYNPSEVSQVIECDSPHHIQNLQINEIITGYYNTRHRFLTDSHEFEVKFREKANKVFKKLMYCSFCAPLYCCVCGISACSLICLIPEPNSIFLLGQCVGSFISSFGLLFCCAKMHDDYIEKIDDHWEVLSGIPNTKKLISAAQKDIRKLNEAKKF